MMLHIGYQLRNEFTMPPGDNEATQPIQSIWEWRGKVKARVCTPNPTPQVLQQQVMYKPWTQKRAKVKPAGTATHAADKQCHKILRRQDSYHIKVKALKYLEFTKDAIGHQKVMEKLSAPRMKDQTTGMMREAKIYTTMGAQVFSETGTMTAFCKWLH